MWGIYKRSLFFEDEIRFTPGIHIGEDWIVLFKLLCHVNSFYYHNAELYGYWVNQNSVARNRKICNVRVDALIAFNIILDYCMPFRALGRSLILITLISVVLTQYFLGKTTKIVKYIFIISFFTLPFLSIVIDRFSGDSNTMGDIQSVISGNIEMVGYTSEKEGTFTYRISWVLERWIYLVNRPFGEQFFGLGLISDSSELSKKCMILL